MTSQSKAAAALLESFNEIPLVTPRGRADLAEAAETVCDAIVTWMKQDDCSESIEEARKRIEDALCDGEVLGGLFPGETEEESEMHGEAVGYAMALVEAAARRAEAVGSMQVRKSLRGEAALALDQLYNASDVLISATDSEIARQGDPALSAASLEMERGLRCLLDCFKRARSHKRETRALLYQGLCVAQLVEDGLRGRAGAKALLGYPGQTHRGVRKQIREAQCALELPPPPRIPSRAAES